jgi:hypothetical protein
MAQDGGQVACEAVAQPGVALLEQWLSGRL